MQLFNETLLSFLVSIPTIGLLPQLIWHFRLRCTKLIVASIAQYCINVYPFGFARLLVSRDILALCLIQLTENKERKIERFSR